MKRLLLTLLTAVSLNAAVAQDDIWSSRSSSENIARDKAVSRASFPEEFKLYALQAAPLRATLFNVVGRGNYSTVISLPNADGRFEKFEVFEASNFDAELQAMFPEIRAFSGRGITDRYATLKLSISPQGLQTTIFRTDKPNEFMEPYSQDHTVYAVYRSARKANQLNWRCSTPDAVLEAGLNAAVSNGNVLARSGGNLKTMRLAQSVTAEYSNYFGATSASQANLVLAAVNATLARSNGVYEKDLALHLNLVASSVNVFYYNASTDPYDNGSTGAGGSWSNQLQTTLTNNIGEGNYDIGHLFGASGGGGNAGCIGCVCVNNQKGRGFTSPADGVPQGDNFDIDYVVHEIGHQLGGNHTFSHSNEGTGVNKEPGSGITIMGYAGITAQDLAPHSIDFYQQATIAQIQANLANKTCPVTVNIANATPVVAALTNYTIPKSTPFALTGSATDANTGDALTYSWEQNDNAGSSQTGASSVASATKASGPNWISNRPTASPTRTFPKLETILAGGLVSGPLPGGDAGANTEALSSVARTLNFRLTVRDNAPYNSNPPYSVGQTQFQDMVVSVNGTAGPFAVTAPNSNVTWPAGSTQTVTWSVAGTTAAPVSCANVRILLSTDGGQTFPTVLASGTANDGTENVVMPASASTTARIKIESVGNIFFDISNTNFTIGAGGSTCNAPAGLAAGAITTSSATVSWSAVSGAVSYAVDYKTNAASGWTSAATATTSTSVALSGLTAATLYDYRVRTNCSSGTSAYAAAQFTTSAAGGGCATAFEPNETSAAAAAITSGATNSAAITTATDVDFFKITTTAASNIVYNLAGPSGVDYDLYITNSSGTQIGSGTSGTATETVTLNNQAAGTYYIRVIGYNGANSATCYTIKATATPVSGGCQSSYDVSTNGTNSGAATIPFNTNVTGLISPANDVDNYKFVITNGGTITVTLGTLPGDYDLKLLNSAGAQVAISQNGSTTGETINYTAAAGTYYAQVFGYNGANSATVCYTLKVQLGTASKTDAPIAQSVSGDVYPNPAHDVVNLRLPVFNTKSEILLYDVNGKVVGKQTTGDINTQINISALPKGIYLIKVMNAGRAVLTRKIVKG